MKAKIKTNDIKITPVKKYAPPKYPTRADAQCAPLLLKRLPSRWQKNAAVVAAVGMLGAMSLTSCGVPKTDSTLQGQEISEDIQNYTEEEEYFALMGEPAVVEFTTEQEYEIDTGELAGDVIFEIPSEQEVTDIVEEITTQETTVFEKSFLDTQYIFPLPGGMGGTVPQMSEADAYKIIKDIAEINGLNLKEFTPNYENEPDYYNKAIKKLYDAEKQVGIEYYGSYSSMARISYEKEPYISSEGIMVGTIHTGEYYDEYADIYEEFYQKIGEIQNGVENPDEEYWEKINEVYVKYETIMKPFWEQDLRNQVRDFIEWLQGQGII